MSEEAGTGTKKKRGAAYWQNLLDTELAGSDQFFIFPKEGKTRLRLLQTLEGEDWRKVLTQYRGNPKTKYLVFAVRPADEEPAVKAVVMPKTVFDATVKLLAEGFDLFDTEEGHGITIIRTGSQLNTTYSVLPSRKPVAVKPEWLEQAKKMDLSELADRYLKRQKQRRNSGIQQQQQPTGSGPAQATQTTTDLSGSGSNSAYDEKDQEEDW